MSELDLPTNPVELAAIRAEATTGQALEILPSDEALLAELDFAATKLGFLGTRYFISAHVGFQLPAFSDTQLGASINRYTDGLTAEAVLTTHAKLHIGQLIGRGSVRAVCFCFSEGIVLEGFTEIPEDQLLLVPVLAVSEMSEAA